MSNTPQLGFGFMRLPMENDEIDMARLNKMVDTYMASGFNYFDTAYVYHGGNSETALRESLVKRYPRDSFTIADKLPGWNLTSKQDLRRIFDEQLERTGVGYFDYYLLHSIEEGHLKAYNGFDCWSFGREMKEKGLIHWFGFSFHDEPELLDSILTKHPDVDFVQLQINYIDWDNVIVHSGKCYEIARKHNKPIIIMEPVKGGYLASLRPELEKKMKTVTPSKSIASWAMRFCANLEGVSVILSGMSDEEQMTDNLEIMKNPTPFTPKEEACLNEVKNELLSVPTIGCTGCRYCVDGCPTEIRIPDIIRAYNTVITYGDHDRPHFFYSGLTAGGQKAEACIKCGQCEGVCPQHLPITGILEKASAVFDR